MTKQKITEVLNKLIAINNDRIEVYETAVKEADELKNLFSEFTKTSEKCKQELEAELDKLGGTPEESLMIPARFYRVWMDAKAALVGKDRKAILNACDYDEVTTVETYNMVLRHSLKEMTVELQNLINVQHAIIKSEHDKVKSLRDN